MFRERNGNSEGMMILGDAGHASLIGGERKLMVHTPILHTNLHTCSIANRFGNKWSVCISTEKAMAPHSSTLAWRIPWTEEPGGLQSMGSLGVRHDWATYLKVSTLAEVLIFIPYTNQWLQLVVQVQRFAPSNMWDTAEERGCGPGVLSLEGDLRR